MVPPWRDPTERALPRPETSTVRMEARIIVAAMDARDRMGAAAPTLRRSAVAMAVLLVAGCGARTGLRTPASDGSFDGGLERLPDGGVRPRPPIDASIPADAMLRRSSSTAR